MRHALLTAFALFLAVVRAANIEHEPRTMERIDGVDESEDESHDLHAAAPTFPASKTISHHQDLGMLEAPKESELTLDSNKESDADNDCDGRDSSDDNDLIIECESVFSGELGVDANYDDIDEESSVVDPEEFAQKQLERKTISAGKHEGPAFIDPLTFAEFRGNSGLLSSFNFSDAETGCNLLDSTYSAQSTCDFDSLEGIESRQRSMSVFINPLPKFVQHLLDENCLDADSSQIGTVYSSRVCTPKEQELDTVILPTGSKLNMEWVQTVLVERLLESNCIFHRVDADWILAEVTSCFEAEKTIHDIDLSPGQKLVLVGDIHGQLEDLTGILKKHGYPSSTIVYLLNGDLVDRGLRSMECILLVFLLKLLCPFSVFITRGNHESYTVGIDSFYNECLLKYDCTSAFWHECHDVFAHLPLGYVVQGKIFVCHGGLQPNMHVDRMRDIERARLSADFQDCLEAFALLWHDPQATEGMGMSSSRGNVPTFGPDVTRDFLDRHGFRVLVRGHEMKHRGFSFEHDDRCLTIFSASNYRGSGNHGAVMIIDHTCYCRIEKAIAKKTATVAADAFVDVETGDFVNEEAGDFVNEEADDLCYSGTLGI